MVVDNIVDGRNRAIEILNMINPEDGEILYGEQNGGVGYSPFRFIMDHNEYAVTVRTACGNYIKIDKRLLDTNISAAEEHELDHLLILGFGWKSKKQIYIIKNFNKYLSHETPVRRYLVFTKQSIANNLINGGVKNDGNFDECIRFL